MSQTRFQRIAHPTDLAKNSEFAFYHALRLAVAADSHLDVLHVEKDPLAVQWQDFPTASFTLARWGYPPDVLERGYNGDLVRTITTYGREVVHPILEYMDETLPDLMVLATHRRHGLDRWLHKEIAVKLAHQRAIATLFVPYGDEGFVSPTLGTVELRRVLVPIDWLPAPQAAVDAVADLAEALGCQKLEFTLLHIGQNTKDFPAVNPPEHEGWQWHCQTLSGEVTEAVLKAAEELDADLIVMVTEGREGFLDALRGSTTERVLQQAHCPLLAVPSVEVPA